MAIFVDGVIWIAPLPGVEILAHQELYIAYDWEYWYRKWRTCDHQLRLRIENRYLVACSVPQQSIPTSSIVLEEHQRVSDFCYKHWARWSPSMRRDIRRAFASLNDVLHRLDAPTDADPE